MIHPSDEKAQSNKRRDEKPGAVRDDQKKGNREETEEIERDKRGG